MHAAIVKDPAIRAKVVILRNIVTLLFHGNQIVAHLPTLFLVGPPIAALALAEEAKKSGCANVVIAAPDGEVMQLSEFAARHREPN